MTGKKEANARIKINKLLEKSGWRFFDDKNSKANVQLEPNVKITQKDIDSQGDDFEKTKNGFIDYLLLDEKNFPLVVLEAKKEEKNPLDGKEQARKYAQSLNARFIILSNGNLHYFWDIKTGNPEIIREFPTQKSLTHRTKFQPNPTSLYKEIVNEDYIAISQKPELSNDPNWNNVKYRKKLEEESGIRILRPYQINAVKALQDSVKQGNQRFLFEMATGTGKTLLSAAIIKLFLRTGNAKRILFLVDRLELEDQAFKNFKNYLQKDYRTVIYKKNKNDWNKAEIVISTVQSLLVGDKYKNNFSPTDFDLLISDEAHRSMSGSSRAVFEYFIGYKLGLTATPRDYLKNIDKIDLSEKDQRKWEKRLLLDTYTTFGCEKSEPTFKYSLIDGVKDNYLINPIVLDARTDITTELLSKKGYSLKIENQDGVEEEKIFFHKDFEKKFFSEKTNIVFCKNFLKKALKDPISNEIGKTIIFCISQKHASKITQILNKMAHKLWPDKYNSDFAVQITSNIEGSQQNTINFSNNNLNRYTNFLENYKTSKTRICVTVGMMTTGYDCQDILNLCLMRPIFSPTDFVQMKGRGTRKFNFKYTDVNKKEYIEEKKNFKLFDFFANCEYFEKEFNYDEALNLPQIRTSSESSGEETSVSIDEIEVFDPDAIKTIKEVQIGTEGMRIDRELWGKAKDTITKNKKLKNFVEKEMWNEAEHIMKEEYEDKPELYLNLKKIRKAENLDRKITWKEVLQKMFDLIDHFPNREELLEEECSKFISIYKPESKHVSHIKNYLRAYISDNDFREIIDKKEFAKLNHYTGFSIEQFKALNGDTQWQSKVLEYVRNYVTLNTYME